MSAVTAGDRAGRRCRHDAERAIDHAADFIPRHRRGGLTADFQPALVREGPDPKRKQFMGSGILWPCNEECHLAVDQSAGLREWPREPKLGAAIVVAHDDLELSLQRRFRKDRPASGCRRCREYPCAPMSIEDTVGFKSKSPIA